MIIKRKLQQFSRGKIQTFIITLFLLISVPEQKQQKAQQTPCSHEPLSLQRQQRMGQFHTKIPLEPIEIRSEITLRLRPSNRRYRFHHRNLFPTKNLLAQIVLRQNRHSNPPERLQFRFEEQSDFLRRGYSQYLPGGEAHQSSSNGRLQFLFNRSE